MPFAIHAGGCTAATRLVLALCCVTSVGMALAQRGTSAPTVPSAPATTVSSGNSGRILGGYDPLSSMSVLDQQQSVETTSMRIMRLNARRDEMKKRMTLYATRLLLLTTELQADLQKREPTEADGQRLDEIAKLAKAVRDQMRQ